MRRYVFFLAFIGGIISLEHTFFVLTLIIPFLMGSAVTQNNYNVWLLWHRSQQACHLQYSPFTRIMPPPPPFNSHALTRGIPFHLLSNYPRNSTADYVTS